jgi:hypothetical protein
MTMIIYKVLKKKPAYGLSLKNWLTTRFVLMTGYMIKSGQNSGPSQQLLMGPWTQLFISLTRAIG